LCCIKVLFFFSTGIQQLTERGGDVRHKDDDSCSDKKSFYCWIQANDVIWNSEADERKNDVNRQFSKSFRQKVDVRPVHAIEVLPQEDRQFE